MPQLSFGDMEYTNRRRKTKRELFLEQMDKIIPWADWVNMIAAYLSFRQTRTPTYWSSDNAAHVPYAELVQLV